MKARVPLLTEFREALRMALNAIGAHKLRSGLTLLGILVGVFSIILVMTAIRALQGNLEKEMAQLGSHTFQVQRWPAIQVDDDSEAEEKSFGSGPRWLAPWGCRAKRTRGRCSRSTARPTPTSPFVG